MSPKPVSAYARRDTGSLRPNHRRSRPRALIESEDYGSRGAAVKRKAAGADPDPARVGAVQPRVTAITGPRSAQTLDLTSHLAARERAGGDVAVHRARAESG